MTEYVETQLGFPGVVPNGIAKRGAPGGALRPDNPEETKQDWGTPWGFVRAVERRFGPIAWDLAASHENAKAPNFITKEQDTFTVAWHKLEGGWLYINPEFIDCDRVAEKCRDEMLLGARILFLSPASIGTEWYSDFVLPHAITLGLRPRMTFEGATTPYPKDLMLTVWVWGLTGFQTWRWK